MENGSTAGSLLVIAIGAILTWAIDYRVAGIDITAVGVILLIIGMIGLVLSLLFWASFAPFGRNRRVTIQDETTRLP